MAKKRDLKKEITSYINLDDIASGDVKNVSWVPLDYLVDLADRIISKKDYLRPIEMANILIDHGEYDYALKFYNRFKHPEDLVYA